MSSSIIAFVLGMLIGAFMGFILLALMVAGGDR